MATALARHDSIMTGSDELASLYATFSEGFDEHDLVMARQVLG